MSFVVCVAESTVMFVVAVVCDLVIMTTAATQIAARQWY